MFSSWHIKGTPKWITVQYYMLKFFGSTGVWTQAALHACLAGVIALDHTSRHYSDDF
jgi:hypothetical protein